MNTPAFNPGDYISFSRPIYRRKWWFFGPWLSIGTVETTFRIPEDAAVKNPD